MTNSQPQIDMGKTYDAFADAFALSNQLPTWQYVGKPAMEKLLEPIFGSEANILDMGSASGRVEAGVLLSHGVTAARITGVEISPDQVVIAQKRIPDARFLVGDIADPALLTDETGSFGSVFSHMVFEHVSDEQFAQVCANAYRLLKLGGMFAFVVTHPDKMTNLNGDLVTKDGPFITTAPWGGELHNWRRSVEKTLDAVRGAGFTIEGYEEIPFPSVAPEGLNHKESEAFAASAKKYSRYPAIRLAVRAVKQ